VTDGIILPLASFTEEAFGPTMRWRAGDRTAFSSRRGRVTDGIISPLASFTEEAFGPAMRWRAGDRTAFSSRRGPAPFYRRPAPRRSSPTFADFGGLKIFRVILL